MNEHTNRTQDREIASRGLRGVREAAKLDKGIKFTTLLHHVNGNLLRDSFYLLKRQAAPGVEDRITDLHDRIHRGALATSGAGSLHLSGDKVTFAAAPQGRR